MTSIHKSPLVSIIIPVYNSESTLDRCILSALSQDYNDIEIIIIDDGSTDLSKSIAVKYANSDPRVKLIIKEKNEGLVMARKSGVDNASGKYIQYLDSDDVLREGAIKRLVGKAEETNADVVVAPFFFSNMYERSLFFDFILLSGVEYIRALLTWKAHWCVWSKFHLRSLYQHDIERPDISLGEDVILSTQLLFYSLKVVSIDQEIIDYNYTPSSMSHPDTFNDAKYKDFKGYVKWVDNFLMAKGLDEKLHKEIAFFHLKTSLMSLHWGKIEDFNKSVKRIIADINSYPELIDVMTKRERKIIAVYKIAFWLGYLNLKRYKFQGKL